MTERANGSIPRQRLAYKKKTKTWRKETVDAIALRYSASSMHNGVRNSFREKALNQGLFEGVVDREDMARYVNPYGIKGLDVSKEVPHHNIIVPKINVLVGEEAKRQFDYSIIVLSPNAISEKVEDKAAAVDERLSTLIQSKYAPALEQLQAQQEQGVDISQQQAQLQEQMAVDMEKVTRWAKYSWKDRRELAANNVMTHYAAEQHFDRMFNDGIKDAFILGEEIYQSDIIDNEPFMHKLNPKKVFTVKSSNSSRVEDADIIVIEDWWSPGRIIDTFYNDLKASEIDIISDENSGGGSGVGELDADKAPAHMSHLTGALGKSDDMLNVDDLVSIADINGRESTGMLYDMDGNVRVIRVYWRSQKKVIKVKYYDEEGEAQYKIMSEEYTIDETKGEEAKTLWINEWWEGTKIAKDIYINMRPKQAQYSSLENPSRGNPGIVGELYNTNQGKVISLVARMKSYQYLYDAIWDRLLKAIAKNMGKILEVDVAKIPANWDVGQWFHYATTMGVGFVDSFKEGTKGQAMGKLAGGFNTTGKVLDAETGNYIQAQIGMLQYIKNEMSDLVGISKQREGQVSPHETTGGVERSVLQSSHITEWWFSKHDDVRVRALQMFLDTAKVALKGAKKKIQYLLDDMSMETFVLDGNEFSESEYGVMAVSNNKTRELSQKLDMLAQAGLQNQMLKFSDLIYMYTSNSNADIMRRIEATEEQKAQEAQQAQQSQREVQQAQQQQNAALAQQEQARLDQEMELKGADIANDRYKIESDIKIKLLELGISKEAADKIIADNIDEDQLKETIRNNKAKEEIERKKIAAAKSKPTTNK